MKSPLATLFLLICLVNTGLGQAPADSGSTLTVEDVLTVRSGLNYDKGKRYLQPNSKSTLDSLVNILKSSNHLSFQVTVYTNERHSNPSYSTSLSQNRAQSIADYFVDSGIESKNIKARGITLVEGQNDNMEERIEFITLEKK